MKSIILDSNGLINLDLLKLILETYFSGINVDFSAIDQTAYRNFNCSECDCCCYSNYLEVSLIGSHIYNPICICECGMNPYYEKGLEFIKSFLDDLLKIEE